MDNKTIGHRIRTAREAAHITQEELGKAAGCTAKHIGAIERGIKTPSLDTFITIANTVGAPADLLLQDVLAKPVDPTATEIAAVAATLSPDIQGKVLKALRAISDTNPR